MEERFAGHALMEVTTQLKTRLLANDQVVPLNPFMQHYIANVLCAVVKSLGEESKVLTFCIEPGELRIYTDQGQLNLTRHFKRRLIESTIRGILCPLKGMFSPQRITIHLNDNVVPSSTVTGESHGIDESFGEIFGR